MSSDQTGAGLDQNGTRQDLSSTGVTAPSRIPQIIAEAHVDHSGRRVGEFLLRAKLGEGGFGAVYRAEQETLGREVAVKLLDPSLGRSAEGVQRFLREARLASSLDHPYAAHVYAFGAEEDGLLWIAMELVRGTPLNEWLATRGPVPLQQLIPFLDKLCEVVHTAHQQGIIHRDLKPANVVLISRAGKLIPKLLDLGVAKLRDDPPAIDSGDKGEDGQTPPPKTLTTLPEPTPTPLSLSRVFSAELSMELTTAKNVIGSPPYMAPEQWLNDEVDGRTDLYALGVITYEAVAGRRPFERKSIPGLMKAHLQDTAPPLGADAPPALDAVLAKAMSKKKEDRYQTALELAAALRVAAGEQELGPLPALEPELREPFLVQSPQPLAEALAMVEAARAPSRALAALNQLAVVATRLLAVLGLAARARVGRAAQQDPPALVDAYRQLARTGRVDAATWLTVARECTRPFLAFPDVAPVPELVSFFFDVAHKQERSHPELPRLYAHAEHPPVDEAEAYRRLPEAVQDARTLLRALVFLTGYPLAVATAEGAEQWMGVRRPHRLAAEYKGPQRAEGTFFLTQRDGAMALVLHPLLQGMVPTPGAPPEPFFFDGSGRHGARFVSLPTGFERHEPAFWEWFRTHVFDVEAGRAREDASAVRPYLGLSAFTAAQADNYFGREEEAEAFANRLRSQSLLAVVGSSGAGKSSFVQAGVLPLLPPSWKALVVRPGPAPFAALEAKLRADGASADGLQDRARQDPAALGALLRQRVAQPGGGAVLVVDQFEELVTLCHDAAERNLYAECLVQAAATENVKVIVTLRDDFLLRVQAVPALKTRLAQGLQLLNTPATADLLRILTEPARRVGYAFEDVGMAEEMVSAVKDQPGALALLSFTASMLWELRDRERQTLTRKAYTALGGVGGALANHAEETLAAMSTEGKALVREAFRHLVTAEGTRAVLTRQQLTELLGAGEHTGATLERLIAGRILVSSEGTGGEDRIEVVHEALLSSWPRLVRWQREDAENARVRDQLRAAAADWEKRGRSPALLWRDETLTEYQVWRARYPGRLTVSEAAFADASLGAQTRARRIRRGLAIAAFCVLAVGLVVLSRLNQLAERRRAAAVKSEAQSRLRLATLYFEQGRLSVLGEDPFQGLLYLDSAQREGAGGHELDVLVGRAWDALGGQQGSFGSGKERLFAARVLPDGERVVTGAEDGTVELWDARSGAPLASLKGHADRVVALDADAQGRILSASRDGTVRLWGRSGEPLQRFDTGKGGLAAAVLSPDGATVATGGNGGELRLFDAASGALLATLSGHKGPINEVRFSPDGAALATAGADGTARLWRRAPAAALAVLEGHGDQVRSARFSADGALLVTASWDRTARLWDGRSGKALRTFFGHLLNVSSAEFSPDGQRVVTTSDDATARVWDVATGKPLFSLGPHGGHVTTAAFSADGARIYTACADARMRSWDARSGQLLWTFIGHQERLVGLSPAPGGGLLTTSWDGTAKLWDGERRASHRSFSAGGAWMLGGAFSPDGERLVLRSADGKARLYDARPGALAAPLATAELAEAGDEGESGVRFARDGRFVVVEGTRARLWDGVKGQPLRYLATSAEPILAVALSPDGKRVVTASGDRTGAVWDVESGAKLASLPLHGGTLISVEFSPDGRWVATGCEDHVARLFDAGTGALVRTLEGHALAVNHVAFSPDGSRLLSASADQTAKLWERESGKLLATLRGHKEGVNHAGFTVDGRQALTSSWDGTVRAWSAQSGALLQVVARHSGWVFGFDVSPDGKWLLTSSADGSAQLWPLQRPRLTPEQLAAAVRCLVPLRFEGEGVVRAVPGPCEKAERPELPR